MELPPALLRVLADSECDLLAWDGQRRELALRVTKDALPQTGVVRFTDVQYVQLAQHLTIEGISIVSPSQLGQHPLAAQFHYELAPDDVVVILWDSWDQSHGFVVAASCTYEIIDEQSAHDQVLDHWIAHELTIVLNTPIAANQRLQATQAFLAAFEQRVKDLPRSKRRTIGRLLRHWERQKAIPGMSVPRDDETMDWFEEITGTIDGMLEAEP
jgi:hypothetical protein